MDPENAAIADVLESVASLLEIDDESPFRIRAYRNAADTIRLLNPPLCAMVERGEDLTTVQDIGPALAKKVEEIVRAGCAAFLERLSTERSPGLLELLRIPGLGPKRVRALRDALGIQSIDDLRAAAESGRLSEAPGFGPRTAERLLERLRKSDDR